MDLGQLISLMFWASVALTVFSYGLAAKADDVLFVLRDARLLVVSLLAMFVVMPAVALALQAYFEFPHATQVALVVLAVTPISAGLPRTEIATGGHASYAYGLAVAVAVVGSIVVPLQVDLIGRIMGRPFHAPQGQLVFQLVGLIIVPLLLGFAVQRTLPWAAPRLRAPVIRLSGIVLWVALLTALALVLPAVAHVATWRTLAAMVAFVAAGLAVGHAMGGPEPDHAVVLAIACANRNPGLAIGIAAANYPAESFVATMVLYGILVGLVSKPYLTWQTRRLRPAPQGGPT